MFWSSSVSQKHTSQSQKSYIWIPKEVHLGPKRITLDLRCVPSNAFGIRCNTLGIQMKRFWDPDVIDHRVPFNSYRFWSYSTKLTVVWISHSVPNLKPKNVSEYSFLNHNLSSISVEHDAKIWSLVSVLGYDICYSKLIFCYWVSYTRIFLCYMNLVLQDQNLQLLKSPMIYLCYGK